MATTGHESEAINVQGLKASLQKLKTDHIDGKADKVTVTAGSYNKVTVNSQGVVTAGQNPTTLAGHGIQDAYTKTEVDEAIEEVAYLEQGDSSAVIADFDPQSDTVWKKPQLLSVAEKEQVQRNIGIKAKLDRYDVTIASLNGSDVITGALPESGVANKVYRVPNDPEAGKYTDYGWNGTQFVYLCTYPNDVDATPTEGSSNLVTSGGVYEALQRGIETVTIAVRANKGDVSSDAVITVKINGETYAQNTGILTVVIEYGKEFTVECSRVYDYVTPAAQTFIAGPGIRNVFCDYTYIERDTITLDQTETDEMSMITGDVQGDVIKAIRAASHLYLGTPQQDGSELVCQLKDDDGTKYYDGTTAARDGTEGDQWMKLPVFWWKVTPIGTADANGAYDQYSFSFAFAGEPDPTWKKWEGATNLLGAKEMTVVNGVGHTVSGGQSTGSLTKAQFEAAAAARGDGNTAVTWEWQWMMCTLFYAWYGRTNSQAQCGTGSNTYARTLGTKDSLGMTDTTASNGNSDNTKFWGVENWWGCKAEWMGRITSSNYVLTILDMNTGQSRQVSGFVQCAGTAGYISRMKITEDLDFIPVAKSGTETTSYCDATNSNTGSRVVFRSYSHAYASGGVACVYTYFTASLTLTSIGSRLAFNGVVTEAESVAAYKAALPAGQ